MLARSLRLATLLLTTTLAAAGFAGCFNAPKPNCAFLCGPADECPDEYQCSTSDHRCHLMVGSGLAECTDQLPTDASIDGAIVADASIDGPVFDASIDGPVFDASLIDATSDGPLPDAFVNHAPVFTTEADVTAIAGTAVSIQVDATDPDPGQTLVFAAPWANTNRDPYAARPGNAADTVGGLFNTGSRTFTMPAGILGRFDLHFTVSDGAGGSDSEDVSVFVNAHPVRVNEIQVGSTAAQRNLEILNAGAVAVNVGGWQIVIDATSFALPAGTTIAANDFLVLHADVGSDDAHNIFAVAALDAMATRNEVALYQTPSDLEQSQFLRDFVKWGAGAGRVDQAVFAGQWPSASPPDFFNPTGIDFDVTGSIARTPGNPAESEAAWYAEDVATFGGANVP